jgi:4-methyl-5(b-hydroxyethyl)-thiazole monophosphate biosynthesis
MPTVLAILPEGFEEIEAVTPIDVLRRAEVRVTVASLAESRLVTGRNKIILQAETTLAAVGEQAFDLLFLPGGPGVAKLRADARVPALARAQAAAGRWIGAICAAPAVLHDAGLLEGKRYTAHPSVAEELKNILSNERVVVDGKIVTSRGAGTALDFGLSLVELLVSASKASEIKASICG